MKKIIITILLTLTICFPASAAGLFQQTPQDYLYNKSPFLFNGYSLYFTGHTALTDTDGFGMAKLTGKVRIDDTAYSFSQACRYSLSDNTFIVLTITGAKIPGIKLPDQLSWLFVLTFDGRLVQIDGVPDEPIELKPQTP